MKNIVKISLAVVLVCCLLPMPYGYYQFVRLATCAGMGWLAYEESSRKRHWYVLACVAVALLFNPLVPVYLGREVWSVVDAGLAVALIIWVYFERRIR